MMMIRMKKVKKPILDDSNDTTAETTARRLTATTRWLTMTTGGPTGKQN